MKDETLGKVNKALLVADIVAAVAVGAIAIATGGVGIPAAIAWFAGGVGVNLVSTFVQNYTDKYIIENGRPPTQLELSAAIKQEMDRDADFRYKVNALVAEMQAAGTIEQVLPKSPTPRFMAALTLRVNQNLQEYVARSMELLRSTSEDVMKLQITLDLLRRDFQKLQQELASLPPEMIAIQHTPPSLRQVVGRETELQALAAQLDQSAASAIVAAKGVAGIGKSTLAAMFCRDYGDKYQFVCWRDVRVDSTVSGLLLAVAEKMGVSVDLRELGTNEANHATALVSLLRQCPALLVVDNCEDLLDAQGNAAGGWEVLFAAGQLGQSRLLLTSRHQIRAGRVLLKVYTIEGLSEPDGIKLLQEQGLTDDEALLKRAWDKAGGHPLALKLLAGLVTNEGKKLGKLLDERRLWQGEVASNLLDAVYRLLDDQQQRLLQYVSVFNPSDRFRHAVTLVEIGGMLAALPAELQPSPAANWSAAAIEDCALTLSRRSLLTSDNRRDDERYTLHAIVRDYVYARLSDQPAHHRAAAAYFQMQYFASHPDAHTHPARNPADVQPLLDAYDQLLAAIDYEAAADLLYGTFFEYMSGGKGITLYDLLSRWSEFNRTLTMLEELTTAPAGMLGDRSSAAAFGNLGIASKNLGDYRKAIEYHTRHLELARQINDIHGQASALGNLGITYFSLGEYGRAIENYTLVLQIMEQIDDLKGQAAVLCNLGIGYSSLGEYDRAIENYTIGLQIMEQIGDINGQASALGNLSTAYFSLGEYGRAIENYTRTLQIMEQIGDLKGQANSFNGLGIAYYRLGDYDKAVDFHTRQLELTRQIGDQHGQAQALNNLGITYATLSQYPQAFGYYQQARAIFERIGANHLVAVADRAIAVTQQIMEQAGGS